MNENINITVNTIGIGDNYPVRLMGIINISSESFYKGSIYDPGIVSSIAQKMITGKVTFLDIGGRSTAPQAAPITVDEEKKRVQQALEKILSSIDIGHTLVSIDTQYKSVAETALNILDTYGKSSSFVLNDVSCFSTDHTLADWICDVRKPVILMAAHKVPGDSLGIKQTVDDLARGINILARKGFSVKNNVIIDPAIGKWIPQKTSAYDLEIITSLRDFRKLQQPILAGISRKSFIGSVLQKKTPNKRYQGTLAATAIAVYNGAHIIRTHDITEETWDVITMAQALRDNKQST